jgi:integrase
VEATLSEFRELVAACDPEFQPLVKAGLYSGCRYSELANLRVRNFYPGTRQIHIEDSKNGHERFIPLNDEAVQFFTALTAHRQGDEFVFLKANGNRWQSSEQQRPMRQARQVAGIVKPITFHQLRHGFASLSLQAGMRLEEVGTLLGHLDLKITSKHYARFSGSHLLDRVNECAPQLALGASQRVSERSDNVVPIQRVKRRA